MGEFRRVAIVVVAAVHGLLASVGGVCAQTGQSQTPPPAVAPQVHPLTPAIAMAKTALSKAEALVDYEGTLTKRELIGNTVTTQMMQIRVREKPFAVYLKYAAPHEGREVIYDSAQDPAKLLVHEGTGVKSLWGRWHCRSTILKCWLKPGIPCLISGYVEWSNSSLLNGNWNRSTAKWT